jgi:hypothetical protein
MAGLYSAPTPLRPSEPTIPESTTAAAPFLRPQDALRRVIERSRARQNELIYAGPSPTHSSGWAVWAELR